MTQAVTVYVSADGGSFNSFYLNSSGNSPGRAVDFEKDDVHPLLFEARQIEPGNYQQMLAFFQKTLSDSDWSQSIQLYHSGIRNPYDSEDFHHSLHTYPKGQAHPCLSFSLIKLIEEKLEIQNLTFPKRQLYQLKKASCKGLIRVAESIGALALLVIVPPVFLSVAICGALGSAAKDIYKSTKSAL
ncbi:MAG: hypothetical protein S4CHLAM7_09790 [Chlamydiae bacterium]|nr:hypothetical protein [Chlamydiota bacterium]